MNKIDFTQTLKDWDGEDLEVVVEITKDEEGKRVEVKGKLTLRQVLLNTLGSVFDKDEDKEKPAKIFEKYELGMRIQSRDSAELTPTEIELLEKLVCKAYPAPMISGQVLKILANAKAGSKEEDG